MNYLAHLRTIEGLFSGKYGTTYRVEVFITGGYLVFKDGKFGFHGSVRCAHDEPQAFEDLQPWCVEEALLHLDTLEKNIILRIENRRLREVALQAVLTKYLPGEES